MLLQIFKNEDGFILTKTSLYNLTMLLEQYINYAICFEVKIILTSSVSYIHHLLYFELK